ncbi:MAG: hypothetical protein ACK55F_08845 [Acidobacteriota bacterium]
MLFERGAGFVEDGDLGEEGGVGIFGAEWGEEGGDLLGGCGELLLLGGGEDDRGGAAPGSERGRG